METWQKLQIIAAIVGPDDTENFKEIRNKKISLENSSDMRHHILKI